MKFLTKFLTRFLTKPKRLSPETDRKERLKLLKQFYFDYLVEDAQDGTNLDLDFIDFIEKMEKKYLPDTGSR